MTAEERPCWCGYARDVAYPLSGPVHGKPNGRIASPMKHYYRAVTDEEIAAKTVQGELL